MKNGVILIGAIILAGALFGCEPPASNEELTRMCQNLGRVRGEVTVPDAAEMRAVINAEFDKKDKSMIAWKARDMKGWDEELAARVKRLEGNPDEKDDEGNPMTVETLNGMYAKKKMVGSQQFDVDLAKLTESRKEKLAEVDAIIKDAQAAFDAKTNECLEAAKTEKVSRKLAQCRIDAGDKDTYWNRCR